MTPRTPFPSTGLFVAWVALASTGAPARILATGDAGFRFLAIDGFHAARAAKRGNLVVLAGAGGRIARLEPGAPPPG